MSHTQIQLNPQQTAIARQYAKFALQFSAVICFGEDRGIPMMNHGNISLLKMGGRQFGITNYHVVEGFRQRKAAGKPLFCQIGNVPIDPMDRLHSCSEAVDLAILDLSKVDAAGIRGTRDIPCQFHEPDGWPPRMPQEGDFALLGGFPVTKRTELELRHFEFGSFSSGATLIYSVQPDVITCRIEIDECVISLDRDGKGLEDLPGISGSPVMVAGERDCGIIVFDLIGVVFEHSMSWDVLRIRPMTLINSHGYIES
jgi:hypothetical protein